MKVVQPLHRLIIVPYCVRDGGSGGLDGVICGGGFGWSLVFFPVSVGDAYGDGVKLLLLRVAFGDGVRSVLLFFALGKSCLCSPVGFFFRVGGLVAGAGSSAGSWLPSGSWGASFTSGWARPGGWFSSASSARSPICVQRLTSILAGAPGWWFLRLHHALRSSDGVVEVLGDRGAQLGGTEPRKGKNSSLRDLSVISPFFKGLVVKGDVLCSSLIYLPFSQKTILFLRLLESATPL